jgi:hypothetical protein
LRKCAINIKGDTERLEIETLKRKHKNDKTLKPNSIENE